MYHCSSLNLEYKQCLEQLPNRASMVKRDVFLSSFCKLRTSLGGLLVSHVRGVQGVDPATSLDTKAQGQGQFVIHGARD